MAFPLKLMFRSDSGGRGHYPARARTASAERSREPTVPKPGVGGREPTNICNLGTLRAAVQMELSDGLRRTCWHICTRMREAKRRRFSETALSSCLSLLLADVTRPRGSSKQRLSVLQRRAKTSFQICRPSTNLVRPTSEENRHTRALQSSHCICIRVILIGLRIGLAPPSRWLQGCSSHIGLTAMYWRSFDNAS